MAIRNKFAAAVFVCLITQNASGNVAGASGEVIEDRLMYSIGGGSVAGAPSSLYAPGSIGVGMNWKANMMCGNMDLSATIANQLNGVTNGFKNLMGEILNSASGAVASLPAMIIQRANPGLYELLSNGVMQGRIDFDRSKLSCQAMAKQMSDVVTGSEWSEIANAQALQDMLTTSGVDAVTAIEKQEEKKGENGVAWMGGKRAGGKNQNPIRVTADVVNAGYNALHQRPETDSSSISATQCQGGGVCGAWSSPEEAAKWATRVLGESERKTCNDCEPIKTTAGVGLTPLVKEEYEQRLKVLESMLTGSAPVNNDNLSKVSSGMLPVTRGVIEALKEDPDQNVFAKRIASEAAMSSVLEKGLMLLRTLQAGARNPNVEQAKPAQEGVQQNIDTLMAEIKSLQMEMEIRQSLATNTAHMVLERRLSGVGSSRTVQSGDPEKQRIEGVGKEGANKK